MAPFGSFGSFSLPGSYLPIALTLLLLLTSCSVLERQVMDQSCPEYSGYAYVDQNGDGLLDANDPPLEGAIFTAKEPYGSRSATTGKDGRAAVRLCSQEPPVSLTMQPPKDSGYTLIAPNYILAGPLSDNPRAGGDFLFALPGVIPPPPPTSTP
jgi:hypothetical protein